MPQILLSVLIVVRLPQTAELFSTQTLQDGEVEALKLQKFVPTK
jgi:hypothetical protein